MTTSAGSSVFRWLRRIVLGVLALLVVAAAAGAAYENLSRRRVAAERPAPGALVDIDGRRIHLDCRGGGTPIVVFESGLDVYGSTSWSAVQDAVAQFTRACAYDRAGILWSDRSSAARHAGSVAIDLHTALQASNERGPYVMVGHSLGGAYVMTFTKRFGDDVAGLVFVDASHPDQLERIEEATGQPIEEPMGPKLLAALAWTGLPRLMAPSLAHPKAPEQANAAMSAFLPTSGLAMLDELATLKETFAESGAFRSLGDRPLVVLTAMAPLEPGDLAALKLTPEQGRQLQAAWLELHEDEASWSSRARHVRVDDARHYIQFDRPEVVIDAVREVVQSIRTPPVADSEKAEAG